MINIAICDDEKYILDKIKKLVFDFFHRKNVEITVSQFGSGEELLRHNKYRYSVLRYSNGWNRWDGNCKEDA